MIDVYNLIGIVIGILIYMVIKDKFFNKEFTVADIFSNLNDEELKALNEFIREDLNLRHGDIIPDSRYIESAKRYFNSLK